MVVGLVGCGTWGRHILRDLVALGCDVPVVARSPESTTRAREGGAASVVDAIGSLPAVEGLVVATPVSTHAEVLQETLERGVPVFCEKPLTDDAEAAASVAARAVDRLFVMDKWRYHPAVLALAEIARERRLGAVLGLRSTRIGWGNPHDDVDAVWVLAPHDLAIGLEIMGALPQPASAVAAWSNGGAMTMTASLQGDGWWQTVEVSAISPEQRRRVELLCQEGVAFLADGWDEHVTVQRYDDPESTGERIETPGELPLLAELRAFLEHLRGGPRPKSSAAEGAAIVATIEELHRLARVGAG
jgi:predicted dehydrogenase